MPRISTFPLLYEDLKSISISFLKEGDYFCGLRAGGVTWRRQEEVTGSISLLVNILMSIIPL